MLLSYNDIILKQKLPASKVPHVSEFRYEIVMFWFKKEGGGGITTNFSDNSDVMRGIERRCHWNTEICNEGGSLFFFFN